MALGDWSKNLTTFRGGFPGKSLLRGMEAEAGGMEGIRRVERRDPDGTVHVLYTRAGMPTVFTTKPAKTKYVGARTFVFCTYGSSTAVIAQNLVVVLRDLAVEPGGYLVTSVKTDPANKWFDVVRLDGAGIKINNKPPTELSGIPATTGGYWDGYLYGKRYGEVPIVPPYQDFKGLSGAYRPPLYMVQGTSLLAIDSEGHSTSGRDVTGTEAVVGGRILGGGVYEYYRAPVTVSYSFRAVTAYALSLRRAYIDTTGHPVVYEGPVDTVYLQGYDAQGNATPGFPDIALTGYESGDVWAAGTLTRVSNGGLTATPVVDRLFAYAGEAVEMTVSADCSYSYNVLYTETGTTVDDEHWLSYTRASHSDSDWAVTIVAKYLGEIFHARNLMTMKIDDSFDQHTTGGDPIVVISEQGVRTGAPCFTVTARAVDYIYADIDEDVWLRLETALDYTFVTACAYKADTYTTSGTVITKFVLNVRGTRSEFPVSTFTFERDGTPGDQSLWPRRPQVNAYAQGAYHVDRVATPIAILAPKFMNQGFCPFVAYTTKAEEAAGAAPEVYIDMPIEILPRLTDGVASKSETQWTPWNSIALCYEYLMQGASNGFLLSVIEEDDIVARLPHWFEIFPKNNTVRIQFANGVKGPWSSQLGAGFEGDPVMDISRI